MAGGMDLFRRRGDAGVWVSREAPGERERADRRWPSGAGTFLSRWSSLPHDLFMAPHGGAGRSLRGSSQGADMCGDAPRAAAMPVASLIHVRGE